MKPKDRNPKPRGKGIAETPELARIVDEWRKKRAKDKPKPAEFVEMDGMYAVFELE